MAGAAAALLQVKQPALVRDVLRIVQGLTGTYVSFTSTSKAAPAGRLGDAGAGVAVALQERLSLPPGLRTLLHELGELGLLYQ